ncbi:MAG: GAF domain-containing protein [Bacillota bacterium]
MEDRPVLIFNRELKVTAASASAIDILGALLGKRCGDALHCVTCPGDSCPLRQAQAGEAAEGLMPVDLPKGRLILSATPLSGSNEAEVMAYLTIAGSEPEPITLGIGLQKVLDTLRSILRSDLAALAFYDGRIKEVRWQVTSGNLSPDVTSIRLRPGQGFAGRIVMTDLPLRTFRFPHDLTDDPESYPIFLHEGLKAAMGVPIRGEGRVLGVLMVASRTEREYDDDDLAKLTEVARSISLATEMMRLHEEALRRERTRLAQEVHDGLSQNLFGLQLLLQDLEQSLRIDPPEQVERGLRDVCQVLDGTLTEVRRLIKGLRGTITPRTGLINALTDFLTHFYRLSNLQVELAIGLEPGEDVVTGEVQEVLRIVQEALMNVHRHARASHVRVEIGRNGSGYELLIEDDGCGFDPATPAAEGHYGLSIMQERATRLGGKLTVDSEPGRGTRIHLHLPL